MMTKNRKYDSKIEQKGSVWNVQITRQITSKKIIVSKEQNDFASEADAIKWAEQQMIEFASTLKTSNQRHSDQRKATEEERQLRSARRSEKTEQSKQEVLNREQELASSEDTDSEITGDSD